MTHPTCPTFWVLTNDFQLSFDVNIDGECDALSDDVQTYNLRLCVTRSGECGIRTAR